MKECSGLLILLAGAVAYFSGLIPDLGVMFMLIGSFIIGVYIGETNGQ